MQGRCGGDVREMWGPKEAWIDSSEASFEKCIATTLTLTLTQTLTLALTLKVVLERAATPGADNADIRALALQVVQSLASWLGLG